jgi:hypothetical protein
MEIVPNHPQLNAQKEYNEYSFSANTGSGTYFSRSMMSGRYLFEVTKQCEYKIRHFDSWKYHTVRSPTEWFQSAAVIFNGKQVDNGAYFTGYSAPNSNGREIFEASNGQSGCRSNKFCVGLQASCDAVGGDAPLMFEFPTDSDRANMKWLLNEAVKDGDRSKIFGTNTYLACGQPPMCYGPDVKGVDGQYGPLGTCYVDPIYLHSDSCDKYEYKIEYKDDDIPTMSFRDVFPWFNECCRYVSYKSICT